jgi:hypothetical protein
MFRAFYSTTFRSRKLFPMCTYRGNQVLIKQNIFRNEVRKTFTEINVLPITS